ncbi:PDZ domain-containing protein MAGIX [Suncus etruscus]|uniref:PDZ domain-containing protein MAGIX n=1 Tax=Suncus etruscus TaxID=109475 RepID=UPI00211064CE|nr:PDZ domain-containing protein MAGIX [Suncus etruscus]
MELRAGGANDPRGSRRGHDPPRRGRPSVPRSGRPSALQLLARLDARPLAARAANDVATLVRRAGTTLRLRPKETFAVMDSAEIEVTDNRLPKTRFVESRTQQQHSSETVGPSTALHLMKQDRSSEAVGAEVLKSRSVNASAFQHPRARGNSRDHRSEGAARAERGLKEPKDERNLPSPGPWLVPSEEQLSRALRVPGTAQLALERATGRRRH